MLSLLLIILGILACLLLGVTLVCLAFRDIYLFEETDKRISVVFTAIKFGVGFLLFPIGIYGGFLLFAADVFRLFFHMAGK